MKLISNDKNKEVTQIEISYKKLRILKDTLTELSKKEIIEEWEFYTIHGFTAEETYSMAKDITKIMNDEKILAMESSNMQR